jgi:hypothetical protein
MGNITQNITQLSQGVAAWDVVIFKDDHFKNE